MLMQICATLPSRTTFPSEAGLILQRSMLDEVFDEHLENSRNRQHPKQTTDRQKTGTSRENMVLEDDSSGKFKNVML